VSTPQYLINWFVDLEDLLYGGDDIVGYLDATTPNPIAPTSSKWLRFKVLKWIQCLHNSTLLNNGLGFKSVVGFSWLHHILSVADVSMETNACTSEVDEIHAQFSFAQQLVRIVKHC
jgi:hypothetical protein